MWHLPKYWISCNDNKHFCRNLVRWCHLYLAMCKLLLELNSFHLCMIILFYRWNWLSSHERVLPVRHLFFLRTFLCLHSTKFTIKSKTTMWLNHCTNWFGIAMLMDSCIDETMIRLSNQNVWQTHLCTLD